MLDPISSPFSDLPIELKQSILMALPDDSLANCLLVSHLCRSIILKTNSLRKRMLMHLAKPLMSKVEDLSQQQTLQKLFVIESIRLGRFNEAKILMQEVKDPSISWPLWLQIAKAELQIGEIVQGMQSLSKVRNLAKEMPDDPDNLYDLWLQIAKVEIAAGLMDKDRQALREAKKHAFNNPITFISSSYLGTIACIEAKAGFTQEAQETFIEAKQRATKEMDPMKIEESIVRIAKYEVDLGWIAQAQKTIEDLSQDAQDEVKATMPSKYCPTALETKQNTIVVNQEFYALLANASGRAREEAEILIEKAQLILEGTPKDPLYFEYSLALAAAQIKIKALINAKATIEQASELVCQMENKLMTLALLKRLINWELQNGWMQEAEADLTKALAFIDQIDASLQTSKRKEFVELSKRLRLQKEKKAALNKKILDDEQVQIEKILQSNHLEDLNKIAQAQAERGAFKAARETLAHVPEPDARGRFLLKVNRKASKMGMIQEALTTARTIPTAYFRIQGMLAI